MENTGFYIEYNTKDNSVPVYKDLWVTTNMV